MCLPPLFLFFAGSICGQKPIYRRKFSFKQRISTVMKKTGAEPEGFGRRGRVELMPYVIVLAVLSIAVALFAIQNAAGVTLNFMMFTFESSLVLVILGSFTAGLLVGAGFMLAMKARHFFAQRRQNEEIFKLEAEVKRHKARAEELQKEKERLEQALAEQKEHSAPQEEKQEAAGAAQ